MKVVIEIAYVFCRLINHFLMYVFLRVSDYCMQTTLISTDTINRDTLNFQPLGIGPVFVSFSSIGNRGSGPPSKAPRAEQGRVALDHPSQRPLEPNKEGRLWTTPFKGPRTEPFAFFRRPCPTGTNFVGPAHPLGGTYTMDHLGY